MQRTTVMAMSHRFRAAATSKIGRTNPYAVTTLAGVSRSTITMTTKKAAATASRTRDARLGVRGLSQENQDLILTLGGMLKMPASCVVALSKSSEQLRGYAYGIDGGGV